MRRKEWGQGFATSIKKCLKGETVADGKAISGKRRLTEKDMDSLQYYEARAIRENTHSLEAIRKAVWTIYFHKLSTDEDPKYGLCPPGESPWCGYNRSLALGSAEPYQHRNSLPEGMMTSIKPAF